MLLGKNVLPALVGLLVFTLACGARAAPPETAKGVDGEGIASLVWNRSPAAVSCISEAALTLAVEQKAGRSVLAPAGKASLLIDGLAERDQARGTWRATLSLALASGTPLGRRELSSSAPGCGPLGEMVVIALVLMIRDRETLSTPVARAPIPPPSSPEPSSLVASTSPETARRTWEATGDATATLSAGLLPNPATGIRLKGVVRSLRAPVFEVEAAGALPSETRFDPQAGGRFFGGWLGGAICPLEWSTHPWRVRLCAGGSIGMLFFRPFGTDSPGVQRRPLLVGRVSAGLERALGQAWFVVASAELLCPAFRERFVIRDALGTHMLFEMTPIGVVGAFGIGRRF